MAYTVRKVQSLFQQHPRMQQQSWTWKVNCNRHGETQFRILLNIEEIINQKLEKKIEDIDLEPLLTSLIADYIDEELDDIDIEDDVLTAIQDQFD